MLYLNILDDVCELCHFVLSKRRRDEKEKENEEWRMEKGDTENREKRMEKGDMENREKRRI